MEPWEALDLDDSDLPSLLRPCKRLQSQQPQISPHSVSNPDFPSQRSSPTSSPRSDNQPQPSRRLIPGPAGAMQATMHRRAQKNEDLSRSREVKISTQDYIRRVEEDEGEDFTSDHWLSALDFLSRAFVTRATSLNDIKKCANAEKIDVVVAMIKSCTPNGLGDIMIVLKDPTDTIHASVHRKVITEGGYGKEITVGSVLVLQKVSVFSPSVKSFYLNISLSNVVKIIPKDSGRQSYYAYTNKDAAQEGHKNLKTPQQATSGSNRTRKAFADALLNFNLNGASSVEKHGGAKNSALGSEAAVDQNSSTYASLQHRFVREDFMKEPTEIDLVSFIQEAGSDKNKRPDIFSCIQPGLDLRDANPVNLSDEDPFAANGFRKQTLVEKESCTGVLLEDLDDQGFGQENGVESQWQAKHSTSGVESSQGQAGETNGFEKHKHLPLSKASFQQWTDEQLDILDMDE